MNAVRSSDLFYNKRVLIVALNLYVNSRSALCCGCPKKELPAVFVCLCRTVAADPCKLQEEKKRKNFGCLCAGSRVVLPTTGPRDGAVLPAEIFEMTERMYSDEILEIFYTIPLLLLGTCGGLL